SGCFGRFSSCGWVGWLICCVQRVVFRKKLTHVGLSQRNWDSIDTDLDSGLESLRLESILCSQLSSAVGDFFSRISFVKPPNRINRLPSSCKLSIRACFCAAVIGIEPSFTRLFGPFGV